MAAITIRKLPDEVHKALKARAKANRRSAEAEIRETLLRSTASVDTTHKGYASELHQRWQNTGSWKLKIPERALPVRVVDFDTPEFGSDDP